VVQGAISQVEIDQILVRHADLSRQRPEAGDGPFIQADGDGLFLVKS
jgi:hypothetical protein